LLFAGPFEHLGFDEEVPHGPFEHVQAIEPLHVVPSDYLLFSTILDVDGREVLAEMSVKPAEKR
jgi:hypothetical protein